MKAFDRKLAGKKTAATILAKDPQHYSRIGRKGGQASNNGGFYGDPDRARIIGALGGRAAQKRRLKGDYALRRDSIQAQGLKVHIDNHAKLRGVPYTYDDFVRWMEVGNEYGPVTSKWIMERFKVSRSAFYRWTVNYKIEKSKGGNGEGPVAI